MICLVAIALFSQEAIMQKVIDRARQEVENGGLPFAAMVVNSKGEIISEAVNTVSISKDPTDHAEIRALRQASQKLKSIELGDHEVYAIGYPCPMCLAALRLAKPRKIYFALGLKEKNKFFASPKQSVPTQQMISQRKQAFRVFEDWSKTANF